MNLDIAVFVTKTGTHHYSLFKIDVTRLIGLSSGQGPGGIMLSLDISYNIN